MTVRNFRINGRTHAEVAAKISICRAFVIKAKAKEKPEERTTIEAS